MTRLENRREYEQLASGARLDSTGADDIPQSGLFDGLFFDPPGWQPREHFGFGAGFRYFKTSVEGANSSLNGEFDFGYIGPTFYVRETF